MPANSMTKILHTDLTLLVDQCLAALGLDVQERTVVSKILMYAELRGNTQGLIKIVERTVVPAANKRDIGIDQCSPVIAHLEANGNIGMLVLDQATALAAQMCQQAGLSLVTTAGCSSSSGALGYYAERLAEKGLIAIVMAGSPKVLALHGTTSPAMGTNPLAFAAPTEGDPLVIDFATASISWFEVLKQQRDDGSLPAGVAVDEKGQPTTSPAAALQGALLAFGGAKGSALALMVETLTGPLCDTSVVGDASDDRGHVVLALDPACVGRERDFRQRQERMLGRMKDAGARLPGVRSRALARTNQQHGSIELPTRLLHDLHALLD